MSTRSASIVAALHESRTASRPASCVVAGRFDRAAIMRRAITTARSLRSTGMTWLARMQIGLRSAWKAAKAAAAAHRSDVKPNLVAPVLEPRKARSVVFHRPGFLRGSRIFSHGW